MLAAILVGQALAVVVDDAEALRHFDDAPRRREAAGHPSQFVVGLKSLASNLIRSLGRIANACRHAASMRGRSRLHSVTLAGPCTGFPPFSTSWRIRDPMSKRTRPITVS